MKYQACYFGYNFKKLKQVKHTKKYDKLKAIFQYPNRYWLKYSNKTKYLFEYKWNLKYEINCFLRGEAGNIMTPFVFR